MDGLEVGDPLVAKVTGLGRSCDRQSILRALRLYPWRCWATTRSFGFEVAFRKPPGEIDGEIGLSEAVNLLV